MQLCAYLIRFVFFILSLLTIFPPNALLPTLIIIVILSHMFAYSPVILDIISSYVNLNQIILQHMCMKKNVLGQLIWICLILK